MSKHTITLTVYGRATTKTVEARLLTVRVIVCLLILLLLFSG